MKPRKAVEIFQGYLIGLSAITDFDRLERYAVRILEEDRLTTNQKDALMAVAWNLEQRLRPDHRVGN